MDILVYFVDPDSHPGDYLRTEIDALEVTWDDVNPGMPFVIEGAASVIKGIVDDASRRGDLRKVVYL